MDVVDFGCLAGSCCGWLIWLMISYVVVLARVGLGVSVWVWRVVILDCII